MSQFNTKQVNPALTINRAGGEAYSLPDKEALVGILLTSFFSGNGEAYYETDKSRRERLTSLVGKVDPVFAAKAAIFARDQFGMRTVTHLTAGELAKKTFDQKESFFNKIVIRPDDMMEISALILNKDNGGDGKIPAATKRGFATALQRFDEYQLAKYRGEGKKVNIYDLINLVHPKPTEAITKIISGKFSTPETFETKLSASGQGLAELSAEERELKTTENKTQAWRELVLSGKIGYFALLRNLRNIWNQGDEETKNKALDMLVSVAHIKKSRIMPFYFMTAYMELKDLDSKVLTTISNAFDIALQANVTPFSGNTMIVWDDSGSMRAMNGRNKIPNIFLASSFAFALAKLSPDNTHVARFSHDASYVIFNRNVPTIELALNIKGPNYATDMHRIFQLAQFSKNKYDRIFIISDMQGWSGGNADGPTQKALNDYKNATGANPIIYSWDIAGHGDTQFNENAQKVYNLSGWMGDKVFDLINAIEGGSIKGFVDKIEQVEL